VTFHLARLGKALERSGCQTRLSSHLIVTTPNGQRLTISGSPSASNRKAVLADLRRAGLLTDNNNDRKLIRAVERATR